MCVARTARRRRKQAVNQYKHLSPLRRPHYNKVDKDKSARREASKVANLKRMSQKKR